MGVLAKTVTVRISGFCLWVLLSLACSPSDPGIHALSLVPIPDQTIGWADSAAYRYQSVSFTVNAQGADGGVTYSMTDRPFGSTLDPQTGAFSWTPTIADFGSDTLIFAATAGSETVVDTVVFFVKTPVMPAGAAFRFVTPNGGETYHYGDTILCTWLQDVTQTHNAMMRISNNSGMVLCTYFASLAEYLKWPRDMDATTPKYFRNLDSRSAVGAYKMALIDRNPLDCPITFSGSEMVFELFDEYAENPRACVDRTDSLFTIVK